MLALTKYCISGVGFGHFQVQAEAGSAGSERSPGVFQEVRLRPVLVPVAAEGLPPRWGALHQSGRRGEGGGFDLLLDSMRSGVAAARGSTAGCSLVRCGAMVLFPGKVLACLFFFFFLCRLDLAGPCLFSLR